MNTLKSDFEYGYILGKESFEEEYDEQVVDEAEVRRFLAENLQPFSECEILMFQTNGLRVLTQNYKIGFVVGWLSSLLVAGINERKHVPYLLPLLDAVQREKQCA